MMELAFVYVDLGDDRYKVMVAEMVASARRVMPDVKITQISDNKTPMYPGVDGFFQADVACDKEMICAFKGHFMAEFACTVPGKLVLCDVDLIWQKNAEDLFDIYKIGDQSHPIALAYRVHDGLAAMPYNTGLMLSHGESAKGWWAYYRDVADSLHRHGMGGWYCDQVAAAIAGNGNEKVTVFSMDAVIPAPSDISDDFPDAYAIHFKGDRKQWLPQFLARAA